MDEEQRAVILAKASEQVLAAAERSRLRDKRGGILRHVVTEFPDSDATRQAGRPARTCASICRERYGVVCGRESALPFDLVLQGDLQTLSLGAFPRWREPKETPDAFPYR